MSGAENVPIRERFEIWSELNNLLPNFWVGCCRDIVEDGTVAGEVVDDDDDDAHSSAEATRAGGCCATASEAGVVVVVVAELLLPLAVT